MKFRALKPTFYDDFRCSANNCKYTCCQRWGIHLTKNDYMRGKNAKKSPELQKIFDISYKRNKKSMNDQQYGRVELNEDKFCPLVTEGGLCSLQVECGYSVLCDTCKEFPRNKSILSGDIVELSLSIGCEEVVRMLMNLEDVIESVNSTEDLPHTIKPSSFQSEGMKFHPIKNYYFDIKNMGIAILQSRKFSLDDRILILGLAYKKIDELSKLAKWDEIPSFGDTVIAQLEDNTLDNVFSDIETDIEKSLTEFATILKEVAPTNFDCMDDISKGIGASFNIDKDSDNKVILNEITINAKIYEQSVEKFSEFEKRHPSAMENIMVNEFFNKGMLFMSGSTDIWSTYICFAYIYILLKKSAIGYMDKNPTDEDFIHIIMRMGRIFTHNSQTVIKIVKKIKAIEQDTLAHMALLIKS